MHSYTLFFKYQSVYISNEIIIGKYKSSCDMSRIIVQIAHLKCLELHNFVPILLNLCGGNPQIPLSHVISKVALRNSYTIKNDSCECRGKSPLSL